MILYNYQQLVKHGENGTTKGGMIKWFGIIILAAHLEFGDRDSLWYIVSQSKYSSAPCFVNTNINRHHFDVLWRHALWIHQKYVQCEGTIHDNHWWKIVEAFLANFNEYRTQLFSPSYLICADECI